MAQIVKTEVLNPCFCQCVVPGRVGHVRPQRLAFVRKAKLQVLPYLLFQHFNCIFIKRYFPRRAILGFVKPGGMPTQVHPTPLQTRYLGCTAACCQGKPYQGRQVRGTTANQSFRFFMRQPAVPLDFTFQEPDFRKVIGPLPHVIAVTTAEMTDRKGALQALRRCKANLGRVQSVLADGGYVGQPFA